MSKLSENTLLEVYKITLSEEQFFTNLFENRLAFFTGVLSTIITAIILGIFYAKDIIEYFALQIGPVILLFISLVGIHAARRASTRISTILTVRAKIEQALGLTLYHKCKANKSELYWEAEPIIDLDHIASRKAHATSIEFSEHNRTRPNNYLSRVILFYRFFIVIGVAFEALILFKIFSILYF